MTAEETKLNLPGEKRTVTVRYKRVQTGLFPGQKDDKKLRRTGGNVV